MKRIFIASVSLVCANAFAGGIDLNWSDNSDNEDGFIVERKVDDGDFVEIARVAANVSKYLDDKPVVGSMNLYRVCAFNSFGKSGYTNESGKGALVPDDPSGLDTTIKLNLSEPVTFKDEIKQYRKYVQRELGQS